jgi:hypothetical protein
VPLDRRRVAIAAGAAGAAAVTGTVAWLLLRDARGELICPASPVVVDNDLREGDFVVLQLSSRDRSFSEPTWARVLGRSWRPGGDWKLKLDAELDEGRDPVVLDPVVLQTEKHGYSIGQIVRADASCFWDRYRPKTGIIVCGPALASIPAGTVPRKPDPHAAELRTGDAAAIVVGAEGQPVEMLWVLVVSISVGGQVLTGEVVEETQHSDLHGLLRGSRIQFTRDCVVDVSMGGP